jgi:hypothetical protein
MAIQWLYYWPKVMKVVEKAVGEAMKAEREFVQQEVARLDKVHDDCRGETHTRISNVESGIRADIEYIRGRIDWIVNRMLNGLES